MQSRIERPGHRRAVNDDDADRATRELQQAANALFALCLEAFDAFEGLPVLAEDIRVLSLNAELAAGRAGHRGAGVRALTQYTRELVARLTGAQRVMMRLRSEVYNQSAGAATRLVQLRVMDRAVAVATLPADVSQGGAAVDIGVVRDACLDDVVACIDRMVGSVAELIREAQVVEDVTAQSTSIATNIAIEAAAAGPYETEFRQVAETMRQYMDGLKVLLADGTHRVRAASEAGLAVQTQALAGRAA